MAEKEYIEREAVLAYMSEVKAACISNFEYEASAVIAGMIGEIKDDEIPTADVVPVRHGEWEYKPPTATLNGAWKCTACKCYFWEHKANEFKYCPNCGARMDGE